MNIPLSTRGDGYSIHLEVAWTRKREDKTGFYTHQQATNRANEESHCALVHPQTP